jgi:ligand-binding SRPBCC domain-containing protein
MKFWFEQVIDLPVERLFRFHEDPEHLSVLLRHWPTFRMIKHDGNVRVGSMTWFEESVGLVIPVVMGFRHFVYEPPHRFGERLVHGPYSRFIHIHEFERTESGTVVRDLLDITLPWQYGGEPIMKIIVGPMIRRAFTFRQTELKRLAKTIWR